MDFFEGLAHAPDYERRPGVFCRQGKSEYGPSVLQTSFSYTASQSKTVLHETCSADLGKTEFIYVLSRIVVIAHR